MSKYNVFISHSRADSPWARRLAHSLKRYGLRVSFPEERVRPGMNWTSAVRRALEQSDYVVTIVDPKHVTRPNTFFEAGMALALGKKVVFVVPRQPRQALSDLRGATTVYRRTPLLTAKDLVRSRFAASVEAG